MSEENPTTTACPNCGGRGYRYVEERQGVVKCECKDEGRVGRVLAAAEIPKKYADCRLASYLPPQDNPNLQDAHARAVEYANGYLKCPTPKGLLFQGAPGLGK